MELQEKYALWSAEDFAEGRIRETTRYICANANLIHLLQPCADLRLHEAIDGLARADNDVDMLTRARFAYNMRFTLPTELFSCEEGMKAKPVGAVYDLAALIERLPLGENGGLTSPHRIVIDDAAAQNEPEAVRGQVAELLQQFVFLNLDLDVMSKSEIRKNEVKERFRKEYPEMERRLNRAIDEMGAALGQHRFSTRGLTYANELRSSLEAMRKELAKARKRPIRIAAMGTKKAGKSVIINCLLGQEYAPTSSELPTPNLIKYIPEPPEQEIFLEYEGRRMAFATAEDVKFYIQGEFEKAQKNTGEKAALKEMVVHYPSEELTGYEIYDTPGPNFAGAGDSHAEIAEACIKDADVCIFVMNYSNHLTDDEEKFLKKIRTFFEENGKFYSLLIAVNRVDERYSAEVEKSLSRVIDYIRRRLGELGYPHIVTFGTSALQGFYLSKVRELCQAEGHPQDAPIDADVVQALKKSHRDWMTRLRFIDESFGRLEDFHAYEHPTDHDLERMSGVPQLVQYVRYIGAQKADLEIVDHVISRCEMKAKEVKNALGVPKLIEERDHDLEKIRQLGSYVQRLNKEVDRILQQLNYFFNEDTILAAETQIRRYSEDNAEKTRNEAEDRIRALVARLEVFHSDLEEIYGTNESSKIDDLHKNAKLAVAGASAEMAQAVQNGITAYCEGKRTDLENALQNTQEQIREEVEKIDQELEAKKDVQTMFRSFELPKFPASLSTPMMRTEELENLFTTGQIKKLAESQQKEIKVECAPRGFWEKLCSLFGKKYYKTEILYNVEGFKAALTDLMIENAKESIVKERDRALPEQIKKATDFLQNLYGQRKEYEVDYQKIFSTYLDMLTLLLDNKQEQKEAVQRDIEAFAGLSVITEEFFALFDDVVADH